MIWNYDGNLHLRLSRLFPLIVPQKPVPLPGTDAIKSRLNTGDHNAYIAGQIAKANEFYDGNGNVAVIKDGKEIRETGMEHITRRQILVDSGEFFLTPSRLPIAAQGASELFSGQASLKIIGNNERPKTPCRPR